MGLDSKEWVACPRFQEDVYWDLIGAWFRIWRDKYLAAAALIPAKSPFIDRLRERHYFDHRFVSFAYYILAAQYRREVPDWEQMELPFDGEPHEKRLKSHWIKWFYEQVYFLADTQPGIVRAFLRAAILDGDREEHHAEEQGLIRAMLSYFDFEAQVEE